MNADTESSPKEGHLDWSAKQGRILTCNGRANELYVAERGFAFDETELPHYYLMRGIQVPNEFTPQSIICGAWSRTYFVGGWEVSTCTEETVYNVQTHSLFVDLRIPTTRALVLPTNVTCLEDYTNQQLRLYARQHVFGGYSLIQCNNNRPVCTRHHVLDWNFVGVPRPRPNKWYIEMSPDDKKWKEWAFATDSNGQHYYCEQWERLDGAKSNNNNRTLALRKSPSHNTDGILVVVGNHFNYLLGTALVSPNSDTHSCTSLVELVDKLLLDDKNDRETAIEWLSRMEAGHGLILQDDNWTVDCAIPPWKEGKQLIQSGEISVHGSDLNTCHVVWKGERWNVVECTGIDTVEELKTLFGL